MSKTLCLLPTKLLTTCPSLNYYRNMANKNTRLLRSRIKTACRLKQPFVERSQPVPDYHSNPTKNVLITQTFPTCVIKGDGVNSVNKRRNSCQRVYVNMGADSKSQSLTAHEPFVKHEHMVFKNHAYMEYRSPNSGPTTPKLSV